MKKVIKEKAMDYLIDIIKSVLISLLKSLFFSKKKKKDKETKETKEIIVYKPLPVKKSFFSTSLKIIGITKKVAIIALIKEIVYNRIKAKFFKIKDSRDYAWLSEYPLSIVNLSDSITNINKEATVLDLGAGTGYFTVKVAKHLDKKGKVVAVDVNKKALKQIQELAKLNGVSNIELHRANIQDLPFSKNYADDVFLNMSYGQIINKSKGLHEIYRVMNTGGKLYITEIMIDPFYSFSKGIIKEAKKAGFKHLEKKGNLLNYMLIFEKE